MLNHTPQRLLVLLSLLFCSLDSQSEIQELQNLNFGTVLVISNSSVESFSISRRGRITNTAGIRTMNDWQPAIFRITELNAFSFNNVLVEVVNSDMTSIEPSLQTFSLSIDDYDRTVRADGDGFGEIKVGGTLSTSGLGSTSFAKTSFQSTIRITISR